MAEKKNILTEEGLAKLEDELQDLKVNRRKEVAAKIKEAREQGDLSQNAEYDAAKDEQRDIEIRIEEIEKILKNAEVVSSKSLARSMRFSLTYSEKPTPIWFLNRRLRVLVDISKASATWSWLKSGSA